MKVLDKPTALRLIKKVCEAKPEKVSACMYVKFDDVFNHETQQWDAVPRGECVVGQVLVDVLGVNGLSLQEAGGSLYGIIDRVKEILPEGTHITKGAWGLLDYAQALQDGETYRVRFYDGTEPQHFDRNRREWGSVAKDVEANYKKVTRAMTSEDYID